MNVRALTATVIFIGAACISTAQKMDPATCPMHAEHMKAAHHAQGVDKRGDEAMGFSHETNTHHFLLFKDGGAIRILPNDPNDTDDLKMVRDHLKMITGMFSKGDFHLPMFIHDTTVPGTQMMKKLRTAITYRYEELPNGAQVRMATTDPKALEAIYNFLRFQIKDHRTGDPTTISIH